jgi:hypothetical protein
MIPGNAGQRAGVSTGFQAWGDPAMPSGNEDSELGWRSRRVNGLAEPREIRDQIVKATRACAVSRHRAMER